MVQGGREEEQNVAKALAYGAWRYKKQSHTQWLWRATKELEDNEDTWRLMDTRRGVPWNNK